MTPGITVIDADTRAAAAAVMPGVHNTPGRPDTGDAGRFSGVLYLRTT